MSLPKITIVTPSYNQGQYLEETILSVIGQCYPNLEYFIFDGGSTDNSVEIIKKYEKHIDYWVSEKDNGQSHAINKGFERASGDILAWLNSDDMYLPGALFYMARQIENVALPGVYFGNCIHIENKNAQLFCSGSNVVKSSSLNLELADYVIQPSSFWTKSAWEKNGPLSEKFHFGFDWEWFLRAKSNQIPFIPCEKALSIYRIHSAHKSGTGGNKRQKELLSIYLLYNPFYGQLYEKLMNERLSFPTFKSRYLNAIASLSYTVILKILKCKKYWKYTLEEVRLASSML